MSQIRDKKAHRKRIATMNPINAKSVQLIELHAFAYRLLFVYLSESFDCYKDNDFRKQSPKKRHRFFLWSHSVYL